MRYYKYSHRKYEEKCGWMLSVTASVVFKNTDMVAFAFVSVRCLWKKNDAVYYAGNPKSPENSEKKETLNILSDLEIKPDTH